MRFASFALALALGCIAIAGCAKDAQSVQCSTGIFCPAGTQCAAVQAVCLTTNCGNGKIDSGEQCDDGNIVGGDGCSSTCKTEVCGNGTIDPGEDCDPPGSGTGGVVCSATCKFEICGNGVIDHETNPAEQCDDGSNNTDTACPTPAYSNPPSTCSTCTTSCAIHTVVGPYCGNHVCDTAAGEDKTTCMADCMGCGNGVVDQGEQCDDSNSIDTDGCVSCAYARCGDGFVEAGVEQCDTTPVVIGGVTYPCSSTCHAEMCGNGIIDKDPANGIDEQCDDGNTTDGDGCSATCKFEFCGNGIQDSNEPCDPSVNDPMSNNNPAKCNSDCSLSSCGDGEVNASAGEACDFGSANNGVVSCTTYGATCPECLSSCTQLTAVQGPHCGDGTCQASAGETPSTCFQDCGKCGNGTVDPGEDCDPSVQAGTTCQTVNADFGAGGKLACTNCHYDVSGCIATKCGNGTVDANEACDQTAGTTVEACTALSSQFASGNVTCSATCQLDVSACKASTCGNSTLDANEDCDGALFNASFTSCASLGYENGGTLKCKNCHLDTSMCASCTDGSKDGTETDKDCGGACAGCVAGKTCSTTSDCAGGLSCTGGTCVAIASCTDGVKDGDETGTDCGGTICAARCIQDAGCRAGTDCISGVCQDGTCRPATCGDGAIDGGETDVDCGGGVTSDCQRCAKNQMCSSGTDCTSGTCTMGKCS